MGAEYDWSPVTSYISSIYGEQTFTEPPLIKEHSVRWVFEWDGLQLVIDRWKTRWDIIIFARNPECSLTLHRYDKEQPDTRSIIKMLATLGVEERTTMGALDSVNRDWEPPRELEIDIRREVTRELIRASGYETPHDLIGDILMITQVIMTGEDPSITEQGVAAE